MHTKTFVAQAAAFLPGRRSRLSPPLRLFSPLFRNAHLKAMTMKGALPFTTERLS